MSDPGWLDATGQAELVRSGQVGAGELAESAIERIERLNPALNAIVQRWYDEVLPGESAGVFAGVPFLLKDLGAPCAGRFVSNGNARLRDAAMPARTDSTLVARFRAVGLVALGRTNTSEFGGMPTTEPAAYGPTRNPWHPDFSPGGSSGGAAAAVASGMVPVAHASDGGGSLRIPAAMCGLVGLKPSQGRISAGPEGDETGLGVEFCVTRSVRDAAAILDAVRGPGIGDAVVAARPRRPYVRELGGPEPALRIGLLDRHPRGSPLHDDCVTAVRRTAELLEEFGHHVELDHPEALADHGIGPAAGVLRDVHLARELDAMAAVLGRAVDEQDVEPLTWVRAQRAYATGATAYAAALEARLRFRRAMHTWWADGFDLLITPTTPTPPWRTGTVTEPEQTRTVVAFTQPFNLSGQPAISLPLHRTESGLPVGIQLVAAPGRDDLLIRAAAQLERARPWIAVTPPPG